MIRQGIKDGIVKPEADPLLVYDRPPAKEVERRKLTIEEIQALEQLDLEIGFSLLH